MRVDMTKSAKTKVRRINLRIYLYGAVTITFTVHPFLSVIFTV
jgi:hypothetical protein